MSPTATQLPKATRPFYSFDELCDLVLAWEHGTLPRDEWNHRAHLAVAMWHLASFEEEEATERVIGGIQRYNHAVGIKRTPSSGYHETLTLFWLHTTRAYLLDLDPGLSTLAKVNAFVAAYGERAGVFLEHYSRERIFSPQARQCWVAPDLKPLEG